MYAVGPLGLLPDLLSRSQIDGQNIWNPSRGLQNPVFRDTGTFFSREGKRNEISYE